MPIDKMKALLRMSVIILAAIAASSGAAPIARAAVIVTTVGAPTFVPTDFHLFAAPIGTAATSFMQNSSKPWGRFCRRLTMF